MAIRNAEEKSTAAEANERFKGFSPPFRSRALIKFRAVMGAIVE